MNVKNIGLVLLLSIYLNTLSAQVKNGNVIYAAKSKMGESIKKNKLQKSTTSYMLNMSKSINHSLMNLEFKLLFLGNESIFKAIDKLDVKKIDKLAIASVGGKGVFYMNSKSKEKLHQKEAFGERFLIKDNLKNIKWKLYDERKRIEEYNCYKASTIKVVENSKGIFKKQVIAWYAPEIPASFGPIGYGGLPGLILELDIENETHFSIKKIEINFKKKLFIKKPSRGKLVSADEYNKIINESDSWVKKSKKE